MTKRILVFNVGSSSVKYSLFEGEEILKSGNYEKLKKEEDYKKAVKDIFIKIDVKKVNVIAHRVVHGGNLKKPSRITGNVKRIIKEFSKFAPLHNPKQLKIIQLCERHNKPQYAVFDTMFFSNIPEVAKTYSIPKNLTKRYSIRRYGFHGLSHEYVSEGLKGKTITCHLGSGSSISAIKNGNAIDTSMGLTPLEGIMMCTRSGDIDPGIILFLQEKGYNVKDILMNKSGLKGITGYSDFRNIRQKMNKNKDCKLAYDLFIYSIIKKIGSYIAVLNGLDNLVFTAKIGENVPKLREEICEALKFLNIDIDKKKNKLNSEIISSTRSKVKVYVKKTNEENMIAKEVLKIIWKFQ